jgi:hypothetical protein
VALSPDQKKDDSGERLIEEDSGVSRVSVSVVDSIIESMADPVNRFYRYPAARAMVPIFGRFRFITPNNVTYTHIVIGLVAAGLVAFTKATVWLYVAFVLCEVRMILDCFDGVLARARGTSSTFGRALDEIADTIAFITLVLAMNHRLDMDWRGTVLVCTTLAFGGLCANAWDFYKRKITTALRDGRDGVVEELRVKKALLDDGRGGALGYWGIYFDAFQIVLYDVRPDDGDVVGAIRSRATDPIFRRFAALLAFISADNALFLLHIGVLTGCIVQSEMFVLAYSVFLWTTAMILARRVLKGRISSRSQHA